MPATLQLPETAELGKFLTELFGLKVQTTEAPAAKADGVRALTRYIDRAGNVHGIIACDLAGAARLGAALTQIPMGAVDDSLKAGSLSENVAENLNEVLNIAVNLFPGCNTHRLVASKLTQGEEASRVFSETPGGAGVRSFCIDIQRYGKGVVTIVRLDD